MKNITASTNNDLDEILDLLGVSVQLTPSQFEKAETSYHAVAEWLGAPDSPIRLFSPTIFAQGSLALDTTVKPLSHTEFDLDLVCLVQAGDSLSPAAVYDFLLRRMRAHGIYDRIVVEMPRCIRLDYSGDFHLDIVPAVPDGACRPGETCIKIPDREKRVWRSSNPQGYAYWFDMQAKKRLLQEKAARFSANAEVQPLRDPVPAYVKPPLKLSVQLLKRWRDIAFKGREGLAPSSIILTTLCGTLYKGEDHPTDALMNILNEIRDWVINRGPIRLRNPSNTQEWITDRWVERPEMYEAFVAEIFDLRTRWEKLIRVGRFPDFSDELKELFGEYHVARAFTRFAESRRAARENGALYMDKGTGVLGLLAGPASVRVKDHTFFGG